MSHNLRGYGLLRGVILIACSKQVLEDISEQLCKATCHLCLKAHSARPPPCLLLFCVICSYLLAAQQMSAPNQTYCLCVSHWLEHPSVRFSLAPRLIPRVIKLRAHDRSRNLCCLSLATKNSPKVCSRIMFQGRRPKCGC